MSDFSQKISCIFHPKLLPASYKKCTIFGLVFCINSLYASLSLLFLMNIHSFYTCMNIHLLLHNSHFFLIFSIYSVFLFSPKWYFPKTRLYLYLFLFYAYLMLFFTSFQVLFVLYFLKTPILRQFQ